MTMALPSNPAPVYNLTVPSTGKKLKFRPFLVKDQKALMFAQQSEDPIVMLDTIKSVIQSCAGVDEKYVDSLASFDIEYIFLQLRAKSVGEIVELTFKCDTCDDPKAKTTVPVNLEGVRVEKFEGHTNKIPLLGDVGIVMKYPSIETLKKIEQAEAGGTAEDAFEIAIDCIDYIYSADEIFKASEQSREELVEFVNGLTADQYEQVQNFFNTMPQLRVYLKYTCPVCNREHNKYMEGLASFF